MEQAITEAWSMLGESRGRSLLDPEQIKERTFTSSSPKTPEAEHHIAAERPVEAL